MQIEVTRDRADGLYRERWNFGLDEHGGPMALRFGSYVAEERPSKRHRNWKTVKYWGIGGAYGQCHRNVNPPLEPWVLKDAARQIIERVAILLEIAVPSKWGPKKVGVAIGTIEDAMTRLPPDLGELTDKAKAELGLKVEAFHAAVTR